MTRQSPRKSVYMSNVSFATTTIAVWSTITATPGTGAPLMWLAAVLPPKSFTIFDWIEEREFIWAETGALKPGVIVVAAERELSAKHPNGVKLISHRKGYAFESRSAGPGETIQVSSSVPQDRLTVGLNLKITGGIGRPGSGASVRQALPNVSYSWSGEPTYAAGFGALAQSEYDPSALSGQTPLSLDFSKSQEIGVLLDANNSLEQLSEGDLTRIRSLNLTYVERPLCEAKIRKEA